MTTARFSLRGMVDDPDPAVPPEIDPRPGPPEVPAPPPIAVPTPPPPPPIQAR